MGDKVLVIRYAVKFVSGLTMTVQYQCANMFQPQAVLSNDCIIYLNWDWKRIGWGGDCVMTCAGVAILTIKWH